MKYWFTAFCILSFSLIYGADETSEVPIEEEIASLQPAILPQPASSFKEPLLPLEETKLPSSILPPQRRKSAFLAVSMSSLIPGLGHTYLGDFKRAGSIFGSYGAGFTAAAFSDGNQAALLPGAITMVTSWQYGIYAAYRDARIFNQQFDYSYKMPNDSFNDLSWAPFSPSVLKKPEVWGGLLGALVLGTTISYFVYPKEAHIQCDLSSKELAGQFAKPLVAFPVGIGEEAFFRGYMQSAFSEVFSPIGGIILSSLTFGAAHIPNALLLKPELRWRYYSFSLPLITSLGAYFGWLTYKNNSLKESVALHSWYDFAIFMASASMTESAIVGEPKFAISFSF